MKNALSSLMLDSGVSIPNEKPLLDHAFVAVKSERTASNVKHQSGRKWLRPGQALPSPSLRIAATRKNRSLLRWLRAAELSAWQEADARHLSPSQTTAGFTQPLFKMNSR